ncbi:MAG: ImmA/IrrE family metallo-endopeptidase [Coleofasciculaceae cyanobacterium]
MRNQRQALAQQAQQKAIDVRRKVGFDNKSPLCIYSLCDKLNVRVKFVDISMEGMYLREADPVILLSALRPLPRRIFTCAHELGHHVFEHGSTIDELIGEAKSSKTFQPKEFLADSFAGFLLMPVLGMRKAFVLRGWDAASATPEQIFTVACSFGVGYETLITHMAYALKMIVSSKASLLLKTKPKLIREKVLGCPSANPLIIADAHWSMPTIDAEVGSLLLLPSGAEAANDTITLEENHPKGCLFRANRPGIVQAYCRDTGWAVFVRVSRYQFIGLSQHRHFEEVEDE